MRKTLLKLCCRGFEARVCIGEKPAESMLQRNLKLECALVLPCYYWNLQELTTKKKRTVTPVYDLKTALAVKYESAKKFMHVNISQA